MSKMMGKGKHMGRWYIDAREGNRSARAREHRAWKAQEAPGWDCGLMDAQEDNAATEAPEDRHQAPDGGAQ